jgi:lactate permease
MQPSVNLTFSIPKYIRIAQRPESQAQPPEGALMNWTQVYDPLGHWWLSTLVAALPIIVLFTLLAGLRVKPHWCAIAAAATAILVGILIFHMPLALAGSAFAYGVAYGVLKIAWIVLAAVYLYDISVETGQFEIMKESIAGITPDRRLQVLLVAFCFGAFIEGAAGFGAPVAIAGAFMIGLGFRPFHAAALNLIANTAPVAWGAIGTPVHALAAVSGLPESDLSAMVGRILPFTAVIVPLWLVRTMVNWQETFEVLPAIIVVGVSFALTQFFWANHVDSNLVDIAAAVVSIIVTIIFLRFWKPKKIWRFDYEKEAQAAAKPLAGEVTDDMGGQWPAKEYDGYVAAKKYPASKVLKAWMPFAILSVFVLLWGLPKIKLAINQATTPAFKVIQADGKPRPGAPGWDWPYLHNKISRNTPVVAKPTPEAARYDFNWLSATGTGCFLAAIVSGLLLGLSPHRPNENFLAHVSKNAPSNGSHLIHAGIGIRNKILRPGCSPGLGLHAHRLVLPVLRHIPRLARSSPNRKRHQLQRPFRQPTKNHLATIRHRPHPNVRCQQRRRRDGQNGRRAIHHDSDSGNRTGRQRRPNFPLRLLALNRVRQPSRNNSDAIRLRRPAPGPPRPNVREVKPCITANHVGPALYAGPLRATSRHNPNPHVCKISNTAKPSKPHQANVPPRISPSSESIPPESSDATHAPSKASQTQTSPHNADSPKSARNPAKVPPPN